MQRLRANSSKLGQRLRANGPKLGQRLRANGPKLANGRLGHHYLLHWESMAKTLIPRNSMFMIPTCRPTIRTAKHILSGQLNKTLNTVKSWIPVLLTQFQNWNHRKNGDQTTKRLFRLYWERTRSNIRLQTKINMINLANNSSKNNKFCSHDIHRELPYISGPII